MANKQRDTKEVLLSLGAKQLLQAPAKMSKRYSRGEVTEERNTILVAVLRVPDGDYFKEITDNYGLDSVKTGWYSARWFELNPKVVEKLKAHPRFNEVVD